MAGRRSKLVNFETLEPKRENPSTDGYKQRIQVLNVVNLKYTVKVYQGRWWKGACLRKRIEKTVLNDVNLQVKSGEITAVLGNSGSGKTSLLDVLASRAEGKVQGNITLHNQPLSPSVFRRLAGYVIQADRLLPSLTVEETLMYTAQLKFLGECGKEQISEKVTTVIDDMGLRHIRHSRIGGVIIRGISGGEKRRVSVAIQLLQDPELLLLDEPTTGLDSFTARRLIQSLADLAHRKNKIILLSIHQPRSELFPMFDQVALLSQGEMVYFGPRDAMVSYFTALGHPCPSHANPFDFYVDISSIDRRDADREQQTSDQVQDLKDSYIKSELYQNIAADQEKCLGDKCIHQEKHRKLRCEPVGRTGIICRRMLLNLWRARVDFFARLVTLIAYAFFIWMFLIQLGNGLSSIQDRAGVFYQSVSVPPMVGVLNAVALFPALRDLYFREAGDGLYGSTSFLVAYYLHGLPFHFASSILYSTWVYWGIGMYPEVDRFFKYFAVVFLLQVIGEAQTVMCLLLLKSQLANSVSTIIVNVSVLVGTGVLRTNSELLLPLQWVSHASYMRYTTEILAANEFDGLKFDCPEDQVLPCDTVGDRWLDTFYPGAIENMTRNFIISSAFVLIFWILSLGMFHFRKIKHLY